MGKISGYARNGNRGNEKICRCKKAYFSCPKGSDPEAVKATVRELAKETFGSEGFSYVFGMHNKSEDMPNEPDHPHVHVLIKAVSDSGKRLNLRKEDLRYLRERFAVLAKQHGIDLNATSRAQRGQIKRVSLKKDFIRKPELKPIVLFLIILTQKSVYLRYKQP